jgi:hypothetical protein
MIFHVASMVALFVDSAATSPAQIQCVQQPEPESWVKWLLPTIVQTVISLLSIFAGVAIAVRSFRANKETEHEQWTRDQKKTEWKELLTRIAEVEKQLPSVVSGVHEYKELEPAVLGIKPLLHSALFAWPRLKNSGFVARWEEFVSYASFDFMQTVQMDNSATKEALAGEVSWEAKAESARDRTQKEFEIRCRLEVLLGDLRAIAHGDLKI